MHGKNVLTYFVRQADTQSSFICAFNNINTMCVHFWFIF